jgi:hypothetical protein
MHKKDETKEINLEEITKIDYSVEDCKKKKAGKDYYLCKEYEKSPICTHAIQIVSGKYYCKRTQKK